MAADSHVTTEPSPAAAQAAASPAAAKAAESSLVGLPMPKCIGLIGDASQRPVVALRRKDRFPFPVPNGWFIVARADELEPGAKLNCYYFGRDLVVYRATTGEPRVVDAYCPHLGAHLGVGGAVEGDSIRCPFHGWRFAGDTGKCVEIPYEPDAKIPPAARVRSFPTLERNKVIWAWHHLEGKPPFFDVPEVPEFSSPDWTAPYFTDFRIRTSCQEMAENNHDPVHFQFVHGTPDIPEDELRVEGVYKHVTSMGGAFVRQTYGLGLGVLRLEDTVTFLSVVTPVDEDNVHVRWVFTGPKANGEDAVRAVAKSFLKGISQDIPIWENKIYRDRPLLTKGEAAIAEHRRWSRQFYSMPSDNGEREEG